MTSGAVPSSWGGPAHLDNPVAAPIPVWPRGAARLRSCGPWRDPRMTSFPGSPTGYVKECRHRHRVPGGTGWRVRTRRVCLLVWGREVRREWGDAHENRELPRDDRPGSWSRDVRRQPPWLVLNQAWGGPRGGRRRTPSAAGRQRSAGRGGQVQRWADGGCLGACSRGRTQPRGETRGGGAGTR